MRSVLVSGHGHHELIMYASGHTFIQNVIQSHFTLKVVKVNK